MSVFKKYYPLMMAGFLIAGCSRFENIGKTPDMSAGMSNSKTNMPDTKKIKFPQKQRLKYPQTTQPSDQNHLIHKASLWHSGPESLFGDRRARNVGDILTVMIEINDRAEVNNKTERTRNANESSSISSGFGIDTLLGKNLPSPLSITPGLNGEGVHQTQGEGRINRQERIELKIAAIVVEILPNGNFLIQGSQEVNVNYELRDLQITGMIRPIDVSRQNTISYEKIAEARIFYGGRGNISELQQPRYGSQFFDIIAPF